MESFNTKKDLINGEVLRKFGNIRFFFNGKFIFNTNAIGLYISLTLLFLTSISLSFIM